MTTRKKYTKIHFIINFRRNYIRTRIQVKYPQIGQTVKKTSPIFPSKSVKFCVPHVFMMLICRYVFIFNQQYKHYSEYKYKLLLTMVINNHICNFGDGFLYISSNIRNIK
jgi:hypothetical protein